LREDDFDYAKVLLNGLSGIKRGLCQAVGALIFFGNGKPCGSNSEKVKGRLTMSRPLPKELYQTERPPDALSFYLSVLLEKTLAEKSAFGNGVTTKNRLPQ
jgi:hypothetical protein